MQLNKQTFRRFHTDKEAWEWAIDNFGLWLEDIQPNKDNNIKNSIADLLYTYTGNMNIPYNQFLRGYRNGYREDEIEEYSRNIEIIKKEICKFELSENIVVYRYAHKKLFKRFFKSSKPKVGELFTDKGFVSTTLLPDALKEFAKQHKYNCLLKIYLPIATKGAYIKFNDSLLNEHEFLLPPNSTFRLDKKYISLKYNTVYECTLVNQ